MQETTDPTRVLIADDDEDAARMIEIFLRIHGYITAIANDGTAALAAARTFRPRVVVMDLRMPGMNGARVARAIRGPAGAPDVSLIAVSGLHPLELKDYDLSPFDAYFVKPADLGRLLEAVRKCRPAPA